MFRVNYLDLFNRNLKYDKMKVKMIMKFPFQILRAKEVTFCKMLMVLI